MSFDYKLFRGFIDESQAELLKIMAAKCNDPSDHSQLAAVLFLLIRASSLLRASLLILESGHLDAYDAVRRAYWEAHALAFEFRLATSLSKVATWHKHKNANGIPKIARIESYMKADGITDAFLDEVYRGLSAVVHATKFAAENSAVMVVAPTGGDTIARRSLIAARDAFEKEQPDVMYRFLWLLIEERKGLIEINCDMTALPNACSFAFDYAKSSPRIRRLAPPPSPLGGP